jgi:hypothetical protein
MVARAAVGRWQRSGQRRPRRGGRAQVFTTCGSAAKRAFLQQTFPWLDDVHIGDSRSTSFEATVLAGVRARVAPLLRAAGPLGHGRGTRETWRGPAGVRPARGCAAAVRAEAGELPPGDMPCCLLSAAGGVRRAAGSQGARTGQQTPGVDLALATDVNPTLPRRRAARAWTWR